MHCATAIVLFWNLSLHSTQIGFDKFLARSLKNTTRFFKSIFVFFSCRFSSILSWQTGHFLLTSKVCCWIFFRLHFLQNECKHCNVVGSSYNSEQRKQVKKSDCRDFDASSILQLSKNICKMNFHYTNCLDLMNIIIKSWASEKTLLCTNQVPILGNFLTLVLVLSLWLRKASLNTFAFALSC